MNDAFSAALRDPGRRDEIAAAVAALPRDREPGTDAVRRARRAAGDPVIVVFDDDPTGTQPVGGVPVLTRWEPEDLRWALGGGAPLVFILSNTRALDAAAAVARLAEAARVTRAVADELGVPVLLVSRGDSTLRGHFPLEAHALAARIDDGPGSAPPVTTILVPAYLEAGRATLFGEQVLVEDGGLRAVDTTEYARDTSFGYRSSRLSDYVAEKCAPVGLPAAVRQVTVDELRTRPSGELVRRLVESDAPFVSFDAMSEADLAGIAVAIYGMVEAGLPVVLHSAPSLPRVLADLPRPPGLHERRLAAPHPDAGDLVVVGSHVPTTTAQLAGLLERDDLVGLFLELDPDDLAAPAARDRTIAALVPAAAAAIRAGRRVVVATERRVRTTGDPEANLAFSRAVSAGLAEFVRAICRSAPPRSVLAKGGITSSDLATEALDLHRAMVIGPALDGIVSLWRAEGGLLAGGVYVVFAGNVGGADALVRVIERLHRALGRGQNAKESTT